MLFRRLEVNRIGFLAENDVTFERTKTELFATLNYERRSPIFGNADIVLKFLDIKLQAARSGG